jgi:uncharacterized protein
MTSAAAPLLYGYVFLALALGGLIKGVVGVGLPLVGISLLGLVLDPRLVLAILVAPIVATNLRQSFATGLPREGIRRFWPLIALFIVATWGGALLLVQINTALLLAILGVIVVIFSALNLASPKLYLPPRHERWAGPTVGLAAGLLNGISTVNGPPLVMYLMSLRLEKDTFVAAYGLIALCGAIPLAISYAAVGVLGWRELWLSMLALIPVFVGMWAGERIRHRINPVLFQRVLLITLIVLGLNLIRRGVFGG